MEAIVLAGGLGTRLRSVVQDVPKCMAPVAGRPFLYYLLHYLEKYQVDHVVLALGYKHEVVLDWLQDQVFKMEISWVIEEEPLGTGGAIFKACSSLREKQVLVLNGDTIFNIDLLSFYRMSEKVGKAILLALKPMVDFDRYGNVELGEENLVISFHEKRYCEKGYINGGIYMLNLASGLFDGCDKKFSFETDILQRRVHEGIIEGCISDGYFIDIGIPEDYERANRELCEYLK